MESVKEIEYQRKGDYQYNQETDRNHSSLHFGFYGEKKSTLFHADTVDELTNVIDAVDNHF